MSKITANISKVLPGLAASAALVLAGAGCNTKATPAPAAVTPTAATPDATSVQPADSYKDGTFTVASDYRSPGGQDSIDVTLTLTGSVVTDATLQEHPSNPKSQEYQDAFAAAYRPLVVGKRLNQIQLDRVSGASLTTGAFNNAIAQIETQTKL